MSVGSPGQQIGMNGQQKARKGMFNGKVRIRLTRHSPSVVSIMVMSVIGLTPVLRAGSLRVEVTGAEVTSATATSAGSQRSAVGKVDKVEGDKPLVVIVFDKLLPEHYDVALKTSDGKTVQLIDLTWYADTRHAEAPGEMSDDDRAAVNDIVTGIKAFTNKNVVLKLVGDNQRAVALMELTRDTDFHARAGDEIIWRTEVWYFEYQAGGWAKVQQQNRVIDRKRFASRAEFEKYRKLITYIGVPSGLKMTAGDVAVVEVTVPQP